MSTGPQERGGSRGVDVVIEAADAVDENATVRWATEHLAHTLGQAGLVVGRYPDDDALDVLRVMVGSPGSGPPVHVSEGTDVPSVPESFAILRPASEADTIVVLGSDPRGLVYGLLELADVATCSTRPLAALRAVRTCSDSPATPVRGICRAFVSDVEDTPWFHDREFWAEYLTELATHRFNRLHLALGMPYNYSYDVNVRDNYLGFAYPFLVDVPGYDVHAENVTAEERQRNLRTLRFISDEAKRRGIHFQLGLWNHAYEMTDSPHMSYPIRGVTPANHADYCAAALAVLLRACPSIDGVTLRLHYEGGVPEPGHDFWRTVLNAVPTVGRAVQLDLHSKGVDDRLVDIARQTGSPVVISAKYWAEHQGLPYHQASVRELEKPTAEPGSGLKAITKHQRLFTRYGYGDFLREDRGFDFLFRMWPGTQRVLLWGDPVFAAGYGRAATIGGALGVEVCEPLLFKGRKGSGEPDGRDPYLDPSLRLGQDHWKKYLYTYRLWGRLLYDPDADASSWRRYLYREFGSAAEQVERALGSASRVLPLVTVAHGVSASNNFYWPEMYVNMPIARGARSDHYRFDTPEPGTFGAVSPFDPALFDRVNDYADGVVAGRLSGRYTPLDTARWLAELGDAAEKHLREARALSPDSSSPAFRRMAIDVSVQAMLARFFSGKTRAGVEYALYERTKEPRHLDDAVSAYQDARDAFAAVVDLTSGVYRPDLTFGDWVAEHGHWLDRLPAIEADLDELKAEREAAVAAASPSGARPTPLAHVPRGDRPSVTHTPPAWFVPGDALPLEVAVSGSFDGEVVLHYRHLNHGEDYMTAGMARDGERHTAAVPGSYLTPAFPLVYFFTVRAVSGDAWLVPGLDASLANQPYHIVCRRP